MQFDLIKIDNSQPNTNQIVVRQINSAEKKQMNKTAQCPNCLKYMSKKTLRYSHKCGTIAESVPVEPSNEQIQPPKPQPELAQPPEPQPEPVIPQAKQITDDDIASYIQRMKRTELETRLQKKRDRMNNLFRYAV